MTLMTVEPDRSNHDTELKLLVKPQLPTQSDGVVKLRNAYKVIRLKDP